jgi:hypothetical protein
MLTHQRPEGAALNALGEIRGDRRNGHHRDRVAQGHETDHQGERDGRQADADRALDHPAHKESGRDEQQDFSVRDGEFSLRGLD